MDNYPAGVTNNDPHFDLPNAHEGEPDWDDDTCCFCGKKAYMNRVEGFQVSPCQECEKPVCENCVECDYDMQGDPPAYVCCQWDCPDCIKK